MAAPVENIQRDVGAPFEQPTQATPTTSEQLAAFEAFASDVPTTDGLVRAAVAAPLPAQQPTRSNVNRLEKLFSADFKTTRLALLDPDGDLVFPTPDVDTPNNLFRRAGIHSMDIAVPGLPGAGTVNVWSFEDKNVANDAQTWPARPIRVRENRLIHSELSTARQQHTIHHHGIEPTAMNDGVGHLTLEVGNGTYRYQWKPTEAGTYFYHCHRNTVLHFERGMYGLLIVDPDVSDAPFTSGGPGKTWVGNDLVDYAAEAFWVVDDIDTRWHGEPDPTGGNYGGRPVLDARDVGIQPLGTATGAPPFMAINDPDNPRLHDFNPNVFVVSGVAARYGQADAVVATASPSVVTPRIARGAGQKLLCRTLNASYCHQHWKFPSAVQGRVIAADGRTWGRGAFGRYSFPRTLASMNHEFDLSVARRWDVLLDIDGSVATGFHEVVVELHHWITNAVVQRLRIQFEVV